MAVLVAPETVYGKELWKWEHCQDETHPTDSSIHGMKPRHYQPYPAAMYKATQKNPWKFEHETAPDEAAQRNLESLGFIAGGKQAAADAFDAAMQNLAVMAAVRNAEDRNMSERAQAERDAFEQAHATHQGEVPALPVRAIDKKDRTTKVR